MVNSLALKAPVADLSAEVNRAISVENLLAQPQRNMLPHADFSDATVGPLGLVALTANANLPGWVPAITISATLGLPATEVVDDFWWPQSQRSRAVKATMVRSNSGTDTTDLQLRQVFEIPEALQGQAELEVTFVYNYLVNNGGIAVFSAGLWSADNEAMTGSEYLAWARQNDRVVGEAGTAVFRATIAAPTATHIKTGPRLRVNVPGGGEGGGTSDINEDAWIGPCAVYFQQPNRVEWSPSEEDDARAETQRVNTAFEARISRPASQIGNVLENGALIELDANGEVPPGWSTLFGGGGSKVAAWRTVEVPGLPSAVDANGFEVDHEYDGTNHTDLQLQQIIRVPDRLWDVPGTSVTMVQYVKLDEYVSGSLVVVPEDLTGAIVGSLTYPDDVSEDVGNGWEKISYVMEIGSGVRQLDTRFRTSCSNSDGVLTGLNSYQSLFSAVFNAPDYVDDYEPNAWDDATRLARNEIKADRDALGIPTRSDYYADANGNFLQIVPDADLVVLGDSQTDSYEDEVGDALPGRPIIDAGIGGEWVGTHILNRMRGHSLDDLPTFSGAGTYRMRTKRAVPPRCISESNRGQWTEYGLKIAEPRFVEFSNADGLIGRSYAQEQALVTVSGATLTDADGHPFANGDEVYVLQDSVPGNMYRAKAYYVRDVSGNDFGLAEFSGGAAISFDAFGGSMAVLGGFYFDWAWNGSDDTTITVKTVTNWSEKTILLNGGTNDIGGGASASQVCSAYDAIAAEQRTLAKRIMFETIPGFWKSGGEWEIGGAFYAEMADVHAYIKRRYPDMVADTYTALLAGGDGGSNDSADAAAGLVPRSLRNSETDGHLNSAGNDVRSGVIARVLRSLRW